MRTQTNFTCVRFSVSHCLRSLSPLVPKYRSVKKSCLWYQDLHIKNDNPNLNTYIHCITLQYIRLHSIPFHSIAFHCIPFHSITVHYYTYIHYITLHYFTLLYITLHYFTLLYFTLLYFTLHTYIHTKHNIR